ncbi:MAG TPA: CarD family transcriptional regulator [Acidimicrobiales bacterium]|nr:CarD family transcriptional regulator [Acidimicrobiales bacterium]
MRSGRRTSARAFAGSRRSTSWTDTCRPRPPSAGPRADGLEKEGTIPEVVEEQIEDLEVPEIENIEFEVGDNVVYPHHGAGKVLKKEAKEIFGEEREYLTIKILHNDMTVMVPTDNAGRAGLRRVIDEATVKKVLAVLQDACSDMPKNWNRRFKHNRDKIKTGDIYELAEVVRNLAIRECEKGLSTGEKQMFTRAKKILASELMYALEMGEEEAEEHLDDLLTQSASGQVALATK